MEHYAGRKYVFDDIENPEEGNSPSPEMNTILAGMEVVGMNFHFLQPSHDMSFKTHAEPEVPRYLEINPLGSALVYCLESKVKDPLIPLRLIGSFFDFLPARLGRNAALDAAVSCLCDVYSGAPSAPYSSQRSIYQSYVRALSSLRCCVGDTSIRMESETLCASILLHMCEVSSLPPMDSNYLKFATKLLITLLSWLSMSIEEAGVNLLAEPLFSSILVVWIDIKVLLITQCWNLSWDLSYVMHILSIFFP